MHEKTKQEIVVKAQGDRGPLRVCDLHSGTLLIDDDCNLYLVTCHSVYLLESGTPYPPGIGSVLPRDFRVVPKVTFHVELEGEG